MKSRSPVVARSSNPRTSPAPRTAGGSNASSAISAASTYCSTMRESSAAPRSSNSARTDWDRVMAVNVKAMFLMCREVIPIMAAVGGGSIINTASGWGLAGGPQAAVYCASKGAVVLLTKAMAIDHGPQNIRVNCICPGDTDTAMLRSEAQQLGESDDKFLMEAARRPLGRVGRPDEIAQAALYLASDASSFVTGTALVIDGGGLAGSASAT